MRSLLVGVVLVLSGCSFDDTTPVTAIIRCESSEQCPGGWRCSTLRGVCQVRNDDDTLAPELIGALSRTLTGDGAFTFLVPADEPDGLLSIYGKAEDPAGNGTQGVALGTALDFPVVAGASVAVTATFDEVLASGATLEVSSADGGWSTCGVGRGIAGVAIAAAGVGLLFWTREASASVALVPSRDGGWLTVGGRS